MSANRPDDELGGQIGYERATFGISRFDLEAKGERAVKDELNSRKYGHAGLALYDFVSAWVADAEFVRLAADSAKRDAREEETLSIAKAASFSATAAASAATDANAIALSNRCIAISAVIIAAVAAIAAIIAAYAAIKGIE